jgi:acetyl-CoA/propionyl-CoA carboxylase biotin carboxyl carrier protein
VFDTVLVANRGEIAVRVIRTLRRLGIRSVAVYSDADAGARHVRDADAAVRLGPAAARSSYLDIDRIVDACRQTGAQAVHPGYGFLAENPAFARACAQAGVVFVGPPVAAIETMGDKIRAKQSVQAAGVPVVPGRHEHGLDDDALAAAAAHTGFPVLIKPSAGGGGKGMRVVEEPDRLPDELRAARREARGAFGDDTLLVERFVRRPRHIEIQVLADTHGAVIHLGERECSLQRRHQKIVEEAPSVLLSPATRAAMGEAAVAAARACDYTGAGTVEFIVGGDRPDDFFFIEMNTRLQVEHPVTELVTGLDLVEQQLRIAAGERLPIGQDEVRLYGHAVEARIYAEDPARGFLPTGGRVLGLAEPDGPHVRVDSGLMVGTAVGSDYDPMLAKVIAWGGDRPEALHRLRQALDEVAVLGVVTNVAFLAGLLDEPDVLAGRLDTGLVDEVAERWQQQSPATPPADVIAAAGLARLLALEPLGAVVDPFDIPSGWRVGGPAWTTWRWRPAAGPVAEVRTRGRGSACEVAVGDSAPAPAHAARDGGTLWVTLDGRTRRYALAEDGPAVWLARDGLTWVLHEHHRSPSEEAGEDAPGVAGEAVLRSPMPGTVVLVATAVGEHVTAGQTLVVVEAMKMEHTLAAPVAGVVADLPVDAGARVGMDEVVAMIKPLAGAGGASDVASGMEIDVNDVS